MGARWQARPGCVSCTVFHFAFKGSLMYADTVRVQAHVRYRNTMWPAIVGITSREAPIESSSPPYFLMKMVQQLYAAFW